MKLTLSTAALAMLMCLLSASHAPHVPEGAPPSLSPMTNGPTYHATAVRAEYAALSGRIANTVCHLTNLSVTESIVLKEVFALGAGGSGSIMAIYPGLVDQVVPPLGSIELRIDNGIPGVVQQTTASGPGVRQVVFLWTGTEGLVKLSATIETRLSINIYTRAEMIEQGFEVQP